MTIMRKIKRGIMRWLQDHDSVAVDPSEHGVVNPLHSCNQVLGVAGLQNGYLVKLHDSSDPYAPTPSSQLKAVKNPIYGHHYAATPEELSQLIIKLLTQQKLNL